MPREFIIASPTPVTLLHCIAGAAAIDPDLGLARVLGDGAVQIAGQGLVLAVVRSARVEEPADAERLIGHPLPVGTTCLSEAYGPFGEAMTHQVVQEIARLAGGIAFEPGGQ